MCTSVTRVGADNSLLRFIPEYGETSRRTQSVVTLAYTVSLVMSIVVGFGLYVFAPTLSELTINEPLFADSLRIIAFIIPFHTLANISASVFKSLEQMGYTIAIKSLSRPFFELLFVGGAVLLGYSVVGAAAGLVVSGIITFLVAVFLLLQRTELGTVRCPTRSETVEYLNFSVPLTFNQVGSLLYKRVDLVMVGLFLSSSSVGVYQVSVTLASFLVLPLTAFNQLFPPIASRLYTNGELSELGDLYATVTRLVFTISLFPSMYVIANAGTALQIFGSGFTEGASVVILISVAQLINAAVGPSGYLLMMTDHQYLSTVNQIVSGGANIVLNYFLITELGLIGAAVATASVTAVINVLRVGQVWYLEGLNPYNWDYAKPMVSGLVAGVVLVSMRAFLSGPTLLFVGGLSGGLVYIGTLGVLGLSDDEQKMLKTIVKD
jgi:O-antigen/teichoic acid export membrane protein